MNSSGLDEISARIRDRFNAAEQARERSLTLHREAIRGAGLAIRAVHRHEFEEGRTLLARVADQLGEVRQLLATHAQLYWAGYVQDAQKEYAEACLTMALVCGDPLPSPEDLEVEDAAYLNGMGEAAGELRRYLLDQLRRGSEAPTEDLLDSMDEIYCLLTAMDYPDALTRGLRRTTDLVRGILEKTRGDLTHHLSVSDLQRRLAALSLSSAVGDVARTTNLETGRGPEIGPGTSPQ